LRDNHSGKCRQAKHTCKCPCENHPPWQCMHILKLSTQITSNNRYTPHLMLKEHRGAKRKNHSTLYIFYWRYSANLRE
jgi:hypothetical protein